MINKEFLTLPIDEVIPYENNPRVNDIAVNDVVASIRQCENIDPIEVDENNIILSGHTRLKALKALDYTEVQVLRITGLTDEQKRKYRILANKTAEKAEWDFEKLELELDGLDFDGFDFGFDVDLPNFEQDGQKQVVEDDYNDEPPAEPKAKLGDIYQLGRHKLMCGDSTNIENVKKLIGGELVDMVFTDPPYDMEMGGQGCFKQSMDNCKQRVDDIIRFNPYVLSYLPELDINSFYIFTSKNGIVKYLDIFKELNYDILCWCKTNPVPFTCGSFLPDVEYILYFSRKGRIWNNSLKPTSTYKKYYVTQKLQGRIDGGGDLHPTMKPLEIISDKIRINSNKDGIVLDIFGGSGSTMIACEQTERSCYMMELSPSYIDVIIDRWEKFTGEKAVLLNADH